MEQNLEVLTVPQQGGGDSDESCEDQSAPEISPHPRKKKRGKISSNACNKCRHDKKKCDGNYATLSSCTYCVDHNEKCTYPEPGRRRPKSNPDLIENKSRGEFVENTLISLTRFFNNLSQADQINNIFKDQFFQLFVHPSTTIEQFLLLKRLWNEMNNNSDENKFSIDNLNTLFKIVTILVQNRENTVQQYFWECIRQIVEGSTVNIKNMTSSSSLPIIQSSIFPYDIEQTFSATTTPQPANLSSQPLPDFFHETQNNTTVQYNNNLENFQASTTQLDNHTQFFNPLIEFAESDRNNDSISSQRSIQNSPKQTTTAQIQSSQIVQEKELETKLKQSKVAKPAENRVKKRRASTQINESTGPARNKQRKTKQSSYLDHVHIMYRPVKPESKTSLVFHKEDPIDNSIIPNLLQNSFHAEDQYTSTISAQSQQQQQQMHLPFEQWNNVNNNLFSNQQTSHYMNSENNTTSSVDIDLILGIDNEQL